MNELIVTVITILVVLGVIVTACMYLVLAERKVSAWMQDRIGPNRVGPFGLFQPMADGLKILLKEGIVPSHVDKGLFIIAPAISMCSGWRFRKVLTLSGLASAMGFIPTETRFLSMSFQPTRSMATGSVAK